MLVGRALREDADRSDTGEVIAKAGERVTDEKLAKAIAKLEREHL